VILDLKSSTEETHLKNRKSKRGRKKSKCYQYDVPNETQLSSEVVHSIQDPKNLMNSAIECNDNSHAQQHVMTFDDYEDFDNIANIFTDQSSYMIQE